MFAHAAQALLKQASYVLLAVIVAVGIFALVRRRITELLGVIVVGGLIAMFSFGGIGTIHSLGTMFQSLFGL